MHFAIEISILRQICKYTKKWIKLRKETGIDKEKNSEKKRREGNIIFLDTNLPEIFIANFIKYTLQALAPANRGFLSLKNLLYTRETIGDQRDEAGKGE